MSLFKEPHPDCKADVLSVHTNGRGRQEVDVNGCQRRPEGQTFEFGRRVKDRGTAVRATQDMIADHKRKGLFGW